MNYSVSEEDYIKAIYNLGGNQEMISTNSLAAALKAKPASITDMLKKLSTKNLVCYQPYQGVMLNGEGYKLALNIVRRHRLWEYFLFEKLAFSWEEIHEVAEELEHVGSKKLIDKLDAFLAYPKFDPHGDPIPDKQGRVRQAEQFKLTELPANRVAVVNGVGNQSPEMLMLLQHRKIMIGTRIEVKRIFPFDQSIEIKIKDISPFTISQEMADNIFVKYA